MRKTTTTTLRIAIAALAAAAPGSAALCPARVWAQDAPTPAAVQTAKTIDLAAGRLRLTLASGGHLRLLVDGVPVVTDAHLYLVKPGWTGVLLDTDDMMPRLTTSTEGDTRVATAEFENADGYARFRFALRPDDTATVQATYGTKNSQPADVEYAAAYLDANPIAGRPFTATTIEGARAGTVPATAASADQTASRLTPFFHTLRVDSALGPMTVSVQGNTDTTASLNLFDARGGTQSWATRQPIFWLGLGSPPRPVAAGENSVTITYAFGAAPARLPSPDAATTASAITPVAAARVPFVPDRPLIPLPKEVTAVGAPLRLSARNTRIVLPAAPSSEERQAGNEIRSELRTFWGLDVPVVTGDTARRGDIRVGQATVRDGAVPDRPEGYLLTVDADGAAVAGHDPRGVYDGAQTLKQLLRVDAQGVYLKPVIVRDWPTLAWRGVHWFGGPDSWPFHERMIDRIVAPLKYNKMVYEVDYTQWASQPKIWSAPLSTPKPEVKKTVDCARAHFLETIPLVNALGHMEWLFVNGQNRDIVADPTHPYAVDPENPRTYQVLFPLLDEAIALFHPKTLHIGHDEVSLFGTFPKKGSTRSETELLTQSVHTLHDYLAHKGVGTMMWGDMLLHASEGSGGAAYAPSTAVSAARRAGIPKDVLIGDWHYGGAEYPSTSLFHREGFRSVASTWAEPANIHDFAQTAARDGADGLLQTTWAGFTMNLGLVRGDAFPQFVGYLIGAEQAWNGGANDPAALGYSPSDAFLALWDRQPVDRHTHAGFTVDLTAAGNDAAPLSTAQSGERFGGILFQTGGWSIRLAGALNPPGAWPRTVRIPLGGRTVRSLEWLLGTDCITAPGTRAGHITITYADGATVTAPLAYGAQITAFTDTRGGTETQEVASGRSPAGAAVHLRRWSWANPRPTAPVTDVTLTSEDAEAAPILCGLTGVE